MKLDVEKLMKKLAWHSVAYQSIMTAQDENKLHEEAVETLHVTTDCLATILPIGEQLRLSKKMEESELESEIPENKRDIDDIIRYIFCCRLQENVEVYHLPSYVKERSENPEGKLEMPK